MRTIGIDPGPRESGLVIWDGSRVELAVNLKNAEIVDGDLLSRLVGDQIAIEWVQSYGMGVGAEVFETVAWIGKFACRSSTRVRLIPRIDVKVHLCYTARAKDANVSQAVRDLAVRKSLPKDSLCGVSEHLWAALAVAITAHENPKTDNEALFHVEPPDSDCYASKLKLWRLVISDDSGVEKSFIAVAETKGEMLQVISDETGVPVSKLKKRTVVAEPCLASALVDEDFGSLCGRKIKTARDFVLTRQLSPFLK